MDKIRFVFMRRGSMALMLLVDLLMVVAVFGLMRHVQYLLNADVQINLTEVVTQNKDVITSKLALELNNLELEAKQIADRFVTGAEKDEESMFTAFSAYVQEQSAPELVFATADGSAIAGTGERFDIAGRAYFRLGIVGTASISERLISRVNGADTFVLCVPVFKAGTLVGTVQRQYTPQEMYELCSVSLFSEQGASYIINREGYILICSETSLYNRESDNLFRILHLTDPNAAVELKAGIQDHRSGFVEAETEHGRTFSAFTPIDQIHDWYLISSIPSTAVSPNATTVVQMFYVILFGVALTFALSLLLYMSTKRRQQMQLERIAFVDEVTEGDSYTKFGVDLQKTVREQEGRPAYLCTFDVDNFKYINSFYGFEHGDRILRELYRLHKNQLTAKERIARVNGDQFVMLLLDDTPQRLEKLICLEQNVEGVKLYLSAGLYTILHPGESVDLMVDKARVAAQKSKGQHFKVVERYQDDFAAVVAHNEQMRRDVERALEQGEIVPFFQPKTNIHSRALVGAEALARWRRSDGSYIQPGAFIPLCEQTGLISLVDMAIFEQTLRFLRRNLDAGVRCVPISVNFSRRHLSASDFLDRILSKLDQYQIPPELIELELTETDIFDNHKIIAEFICRLHEHGLQIAMDDFGSGYSSLHLLKDVELDVLKIDRGLLLDSEHNPRQRAIFAAVAQMAQALQIQVVVEGVETAENVQLMDEFGCTIAQGYYYSKPLEESAFEIIYQRGDVT